HLPQSGLGDRSIGRIHEYGNTNGLWHQVMQEPQPLGRQLRVEKIDARSVTTRSGEAGDKTKPDRVCGDTEDDDRPGFRAGRLPLPLPPPQTGSEDHDRSAMRATSYELFAICRTNPGDRHEQKRAAVVTARRFRHWAGDRGGL